MIEIVMMSSPQTFNEERIGTSKLFVNSKASIFQGFLIEALLNKNNELESIHIVS